MIAMALVHNPDVLIADEPTTALDVTVQAQILELIDRVKKEFDIGVDPDHARPRRDRGRRADVMVMYAGRAMERGPAAEMFDRPLHPYTWGLLESMPTVDAKGSAPDADRGLAAVADQRRRRAARSTRAARTGSSPCDKERPELKDRGGGHPEACHLSIEDKRRLWAEREARADSGGRVSERRRRRWRTSLRPAERGRARQVEHLTKHFPITRGIIFQREIGRVHAVEDVGFDILPGETLGLVGESGCGKSTTARLMTQLIEPTCGHDPLRRAGHHRASSRAKMRPLRREMQMIFQDPYSSLNPRQTVGQIIGAPFAIHKTEKNVRRRVQELMDRVGLNPEHYNRYPHEFSGGQRQRIGVARALALSPKLIVCDEPVSALDVSIQAQILNLLEGLQDEFDLTYLFISHDLGVVRHISDRIAVMYLGRIVELGDADELYENPQPPVHGGAALGRAEGPPRRRVARQGADRPHRRRAVAGRPAAGLCLPPPLPEGAARLGPARRGARELPHASSRRSTRLDRGQRVACWYPSRPGTKCSEAAQA